MAYTSLITSTEITVAIDDIRKKLMNIVKMHKNTYQSELYKFMSEYANRVDVYSVGMLIVTIYQDIDYKGVSKKLQDEFYSFIKNLINPNMFLRFTPKEAYENYNKLYLRLK